MKPWETLRREALGMWRSVRYDLGGRADPHEDGDGSDPDGWYSEPLPEREGVFAPLRDPRRLITAVGVASVIMASATGTYFAVAGGLGILITDAAGVPVSPAAAPFVPFAPAPHSTSKGPVQRGNKPVHRTSPTPSASATALPVPVPTAPTGQQRAEPTQVPTAAPTSTQPTRTQAPESTPSVTSSNSPSPSPSTSASESPPQPLPSAGG